MSRIILTKAWPLRMFNRNLATRWLVLRKISKDSKDFDALTHFRRWCGSRSPRNFRSRVMRGAPPHSIWFFLVKFTVTDYSENLRVKMLVHLIWLIP